MSDLKKMNEGTKYSHGSIGSIADFNGKVFVKDGLNESSCEISFGVLNPGEAVPFFHSHRENEENYIILSGNGLFQVNDEVFPIGEGSVVRVSTGCDRNLKNTSDGRMVYICVQAKEGSLGGYTMTDAELTDRVSLL